MSCRMWQGIEIGYKHKTLKKSSIEDIFFCVRIYLAVRAAIFITKISHSDEEDERKKVKGWIRKKLVKGKLMIQWIS